jgi:hypothetical protein
VQKPHQIASATGTSLGVSSLPKNIAKIFGRVVAWFLHTALPQKVQIAFADLSHSLSQHSIVFSFSHTQFLVINVAAIVPICRDQGCSG